MLQFEPSFYCFRKAARFSTLAVGVAYFLFACSAPLLIERIGRRALSLFQLTFCTVALVLLSIFTWIQTNSNVSACSFLEFWSIYQYDTVGPKIWTTTNYKFLCFLFHIWKNLLSSKLSKFLFLRKFKHSVDGGFSKFSIPPTCCIGWGISP